MVSDRRCPPPSPRCMVCRGSCYATATRVKYATEGVASRSPGVSAVHDGAASRRLLCLSGERDLNAGRMRGRTADVSASRGQLADTLRRTSDSRSVDDDTATTSSRRSLSSTSVSTPSRSSITTSPHCRILPPTSIDARRMTPDDRTTRVTDAERKTEPIRYSA